MSIKFEVLGSGCANCKATENLIRKTAEATGVSVEVKKIEDIESIMGYGIMATPGVVVDGVVLHAGGVPTKEAVLSWLTRSAS